MISASAQTERIFLYEGQGSDRAQGHADTRDPALLPFNCAHFRSRYVICTDIEIRERSRIHSRPLFHERSTHEDEDCRGNGGVQPGPDAARASPGGEEPAQGHALVLV